MFADIGMPRQLAAAEAELQLAGVSAARAWAGGSDAGEGIFFEGQEGADRVPAPAAADR